MEITIPENAQKIISLFEDNGYEAYVVGGFIRDAIIGVESHDCDVAVEPEPSVAWEILKDAGFDVRDIRIKSGVIGVYFGEDFIEVASFRGDGEYIDRRRPAWVDFNVSIREDLARRDFTMNAMAYSHDAGIIDPFGGQADIKRRVVRAVGNPEERFNQDPIRMIRAIRFLSKFGFQIDEKTYEYMVECAPLISHTNMELVQLELFKIFKSQYPSAIAEIFYTGMHKHIRNESGVAPIGNISVESIRWDAMGMAKNIIVRLAIFFNMPNASYVMSQMHFEKYYIRSVSVLSHALENIPIAAHSGYVRWAVSRVGVPVFLEMLESYKCLGEDVSGMEKILARAIEYNESMSLRDLAINGDDIVAIGAIGRQVGEILNELMRIVAFNQHENERENLLNIVQKFIA